MNSRRLNFIDFVRGLAIINMVAFHLIYDLVNIYGYKIEWFEASAGYIWQQYICWSFIWISGVSCSLSRNNLKRGLKLMGIALIITLTTTILYPDMSIKFGIIHFIALGVIISSFIESPRLLKITENKEIYYTAFMFLIFIAFRNEKILNTDFIEKLPGSFIIGFPKKDFFSADYFPLIPWIFLLWTGYFSGKIIKKNYMKVIQYDVSENIVSRIGKHSLAIYVLHQIVIIILLKILIG